ncbi:MAG: rhodanese-like domain-containing protein [Gammaproteobacteria bacterium]|nr:rhodanese-like domain-containing protein [Gammaproteobacteria bacterium]
MKENRFSLLICLTTIGLTLSTQVLALDVNIAKGMPSVNTVHNDKLITIQRIQDQNHVLTGSYTKTSRNCPPFCVQPMQVAPGVTTVAELELLDFIKTKLNNASGIIIDARTPSWYKKGTIPGSINIPFTSFKEDASPMLISSALSKLGVRKKSQADSASILDTALSFFTNKNVANSVWDFENAKDILLWCNGLWCGQSPRAIKGLLALGYPAEKIYYYRGGMQAWQSLGLTVEID